MDAETTPSQVDKAGHRWQQGFYDIEGPILCLKGCANLRTHYRTGDSCRSLRQVIKEGGYYRSSGAVNAVSDGAETLQP